MTETPSVTSNYFGDAELREKVRAAMEVDKKLSQAIASKEIGISATTLSQWLSARYAGDNEGIEAKVRMWIEGLHARRMAAEALPSAPGWVSTPTGERIIQALRYGQVAGDIVLVYGAAGVSKTQSILRYQSSSPNVWVATMKPSTSTVMPCLEEIGDTLGVRESGGGASRLQRMIAKKVANTAGLLVVDEAQHLSVLALDEVRSIHDATGIGIALVGNTSLYTRMTGGDKMAPMLDRLFSRIGKKLQVKKSTDADIVAMIEAWGIADKACQAVLIDIARQPGALRGLTKTLRLASMYSAAEGRGICCEDVKAAWRELGGAA
jgi:DNA transposition AAA+ family ATPase